MWSNYNSLSYWHVEWQSHLKFYHQMHQISRWCWWWLLLLLLFSYSDFLSILGINILFHVWNCFSFHSWHALLIRKTTRMLFVNQSDIRYGKILKLILFSTISERNLLSFVFICRKFWHVLRYLCTAYFTFFYHWIRWQKKNKWTVKKKWNIISSV